MPVSGAAEYFCVSCESFIVRVLSHADSKSIWAMSEPGVSRSEGAGWAHWRIMR